MPTIVVQGQARRESDQPRDLNHQFQSAVDHYHAGQLTAAASELQALLPQAPKSFEVHELLGLIYAAQSQDGKAVDQLQIAARLQPRSGAAHTNLAAALVRTGQTGLAEAEFHKALDLEPQSYDANHDLGEFYIQAKQIALALPLLETAQKINPASYNNGYDLALALFMTGRPADARPILQTLEQQHDTGELHNLLGQIDEKDGKFIDAANEFKTAANLDPSEDNLFVWGSELLLHRTYDPAVAVFQAAAQRYPDSPRLRTGLGMALYSQGKYDDAVKSLLTAADLDPTDPRCYIFLSKAYLSSPNQAEDVIQRFRRYARLQPNNALAQYYYAVSLWKGKRAEESAVDFQTVEELLQKSIALDSSLAETHLQLGILYADHREYAKALPEYQLALTLSPNLADAHYRLAQYYVHAGEKDRAQQEFDTFQKLKSEHQAAVDKERAEVEQFVYSAKPTSSAKP